jgi:hypothetical protein
MSIAATIAVPFDITINGQRGKLHPVSLYELGQCEASYVAYLTRQAFEATEGLSAACRKEALEAAAAKAADLEVDAMPVFEWIVGTSEGLCRCLAACIVLEGGEYISPRHAGQWHTASGGNKQGSITDKWLIASKLRSDPTEAAPAAQTNESTEAGDSGQ